MKKLTEQIYNLLKENNISKNEMLNELSIVYDDLELCLWENLNISPMMLYSLKDIVWFNLEHIPNGGSESGISDLSHLGTIFPSLIYLCNDNDFISVEEIPRLLKELEEITLKWDINWKIVNLYTKSHEGWKGGKDASKVIIYDAKKESPSKFGYNSTYGSIIDSRGNNIKKYDLNTVLCAVDISIGEYINGKILYNFVIKLKESCKKALNNNKDIKVIFEQFKPINYEV